MANPNMFPPFWRDPKNLDKLWHFIGGGLIYLFCIGFLNLFTRIGFLPVWMADPIWREVLSLSTVFAAGIIKELWDMVKALHPSKFDLLDIAATWLGGIVTFGVYVLMRLAN